MRAARFGKTKRKGWPSSVLAAGALVAVLAGIFVSACASEDPVIFGDPDCPAGRCQTGSSGMASSGGTGCTAEGGVCAVRFGEDIFTPIFDSAGSAKCADVACHGDPANVQGDLLLVPGDAAASREALLAYQFDKPAGPYITCATPQDSKLLGNLAVAAGETNPYGKLPLLMPILGDPAVTAEPLTAQQLELIYQWIVCGAPNN